MGEAMACSPRSPSLCSPDCGDKEASSSQRRERHVAQQPCAQPHVGIHQVGDIGSRFYG